MNINPIPALVALTMAGALSLTACGDDTEAISKADFIEQANALCEQSNTEVERLFETVLTDVGELDENDPEDLDQIFEAWAEVVTEAGPVWSQSIADIRALGAPEGDEELVEAVLDDFDAALAWASEAFPAAAAGDEAARQAVQSEDDPFTDVNRQARDYGLTTCGDEG